MFDLGRVLSLLIAQIHPGIKQRAQPHTGLQAHSSNGSQIFGVSHGAEQQLVVQAVRPDKSILNV